MGHARDVVGLDYQVFGGTDVYVDDQRRNGQTAKLGDLPTNVTIPPTPASSNVSAFEPQTQAHSTIRDALRQALPSTTDITILQGKISGISALRYQSIQSNYKFCGSPLNDRPIIQDSTPNLLYPETHPVLLARQMLLFAAALQYISPGEVVPNLSKHHHAIMEGLAESAIRLVITNDALLGTLEGLENIILEGFYHIDGGNMRRAWLAMRRAITAAQLMGLHRPGHYRYKVVDDRNDLGPEAMWISIVTMERVLSMLLGLPTSTGGIRFPTLDASKDPGVLYSLPRTLGGVIAKILDRNQIEMSQQALDLTKAIDTELMEIAQHMPPSFWRPTDFTGLQRDSAEAFHEARRAFDHMCYYTSVIQLHLPHMLCPSDASQRTYSKMTCVNASREILVREIALRTFNPIRACCRMSDFLALIAGMTLVLAHAVSHCGQAENLLQHSRLGDRATVARALECMRSMPELRQDMLAVKCAALLKDLLAIEAAAADQSNYAVDVTRETNGVIESDRDLLIMRVPYIGGIKISKTGISAVAPTREEQDRGLHEGVTIGGIGSIRINTPSSQVKDTSDLESGPGQHKTAAVATELSSHQAFGPHIGHEMSGDFIMPPDQMFPDAAASLDDWVFQGLDTAFFDTLMRGAGDQMPDGSTAEGWDLSTFT